MFFAIVHWLINPALILVLSRLLFGRFRTLSFPNVFLGTYFVLIYVRALEVHVSRSPPQAFILSVWTVPYIVVLSAAFVMLAGGHGPKGIERAFQSDSYASAMDRRLVGALWAASAAALSIPIIYVLDIGYNNIGLIYMIRNPGRAVEAMQLRIGGLVSNHSPLLTMVYSYGRALLYPLYTAVLGSLWARGLVSGRHFLAVVASAMAFVSFTGAKAPLAILLAAALISVYIAKQGRVSRIAFGIAGGIALFVPALVYPLLYGSSGLSALTVAAENLWRRLTLVPSSVTASYFTAFEYRFEHLGFRSNRVLAFLANEEYEPAARLMYERFAGGTIEGGLVNGSYFASFFADWGSGGVVIGTLVVGLSLGALQLFYDRFQNDLLGIGFRAVNLLAVTQLIITNFYSASLGRGLLSLPFLLLIARVVVQSSRKQVAVTGSNYRRSYNAS